ncbi:MAG: GIY-YIG nuclease family protein, partial [Methanobrevibacter sp.]|nr:GIY-YIG nuclease family protein [Methanobrevibacter sp.]
YKAQFAEIWKYIKCLVFSKDEQGYAQLFWSYVYDNYFEATPDELEDIIKEYCNAKVWHEFGIVSSRDDEDNDVPSDYEVVESVQPVNPVTLCLPKHPECLTEKCYELLRTLPCLTKHELARELPGWKSHTMTIPGCYIIYNQRTDKYYVGQSGDLFRRLKEHLDGRGSGGKRIDFEMASNDPVLIRWLPCFDAGYRDLNEMERDLIAAYDSYNNGYNLTKGNGR